MTDDSIEGLLKNLKQTLDMNSNSSKISSSEVVVPKKNFDNFNPNTNDSSDSVFILRKKENKKNSDKNLLKENILCFLEKEVRKFVLDFCSSDDGINYIKLLIAKLLESQEDFIKQMLKDEISNKIQEVLSAK